MVRKTAKHVPRNQKKYWRKISTKDIEDQLEDVRVQEMTGYDFDQDRCTLPDKRI